ncbi:DsbA family protein [Sporolactobacillus inulinus]|uniref:DsbA family protein n=1 Tax=Sporolactobacillus inulinus TaxID=2078 RepID=UPI0035A24BF4
MKGLSDKEHANQRTNDQKRKGRIVLFSSIIVIILIAAIMAMVYRSQKQDAQPKEKKQTTRTQTRINYAGQPYIGSSNAPVKLVVFSDYRCPYCKQFEEDVVPKLKKEYIDTGKVSLYFINDTILGPGSVLAANASEEVYHQNPKAFWTFHKALFAAQKNEKEEWVTKELLTDIAQKTVPSFDLKAFQSALNNKTRQNEVDKDTAMADSLGVPGTPTIFVGDQMIEDGLDDVALTAAIDQALENNK